VRGRMPTETGPGLWKDRSVHRCRLCQKLTVQIVVDGKVVKQASTTASYGVTQVSWSASE
jgi:hypothetical protein